MLSVGTNIGSLYATAAASSAARGMEVAMERLATGKRINAARDDAAGIAISSRLESNIRGLNQAVRNALDAQALLDTAEGGLQEVAVILQRLRELAVQAANQTNSQNDIGMLNQEAVNLIQEISRIKCTTSWAGSHLLDGTFLDKQIQIGTNANSKNSLIISIPDLHINNEIHYFCTSAQLQMENISAYGNAIAIENISSIVVNETTNSNQDRPVITKLSNGQLLVSWSSNQDSWGEGIYARILDPNGSPASEEFQINQTEIFNQREPSIDTIGSGYFVATWSTMEEDGRRWDVKGRIFDNSGISITSEFKINQETLFTPDEPNSHGLPSVRRVDDNSFLVTWQTTNQIIGRLFDNAGLPYGDQFYLMNGTRPAAEIDDNGKVIVVASRNFEIKASSFSAGANPVISQTVVADDTDGRTKHDPRVSALSNGGFVISWSEYDPVSNKYSANLRLFDSDLQATTDEIVIGSDGSHDISRPSVLGLSNGDIVVSWQQNNSPSLTELFFQRFSSSGSPLGDPINLDYQGNFDNVNIVGDKSMTEATSGNIAIVWTNTGIDGSGNGVILKGVSFNSTQVAEQGSTMPTSVNDAEFMSLIDNWLTGINGLRGYLGALSNRLDHTVAINTNILFNSQASLARIVDADYALESTRLAKNQILQQASVAMLAQANASKKSILQLLEAR